MSERLYALRNGWRWAGWYLWPHRLGGGDRWTLRPIAALRQLWSAYVLGHIGESCQDCGRRYLLWHAPDDLYGQVTRRQQREGQSATGLFCLACFDRRAERLGMTLVWWPMPMAEWPATDDALSRLLVEADHE